mmetsp:Transcript_22284/g.56315  ORF Transcript_22284/g.56315 Transcript_22284/m.56315 type:complete len:556 (-) Transcript_22284:183-1850(-)|eukprot:CAMPEP_0178996332 /NCGR_PEP_ID=MMETSP0795-20121207/8314_1 /TAXON_ID=88552 /ORGANISM="Amoebophrya sp., Strain Ameob2" /LENGTH=555 /DNA_ID=CAMNT_0020688719 /DNA_START=109 /DNA_END=1776 /DNA_ORIENTATION=-
MPASRSDVPPLCELSSWDTPPKPRTGTRRRRRTTTLLSSLFVVVSVEIGQHAPVPVAAAQESMAAPGPKPLMRREGTRSSTTNLDESQQPLDLDEMTSSDHDEDANGNAAQQHAAEDDTSALPQSSSLLELSDAGQRDAMRYAFVRPHPDEKNSMSAPKGAMQIYRVKNLANEYQRGEAKAYHEFLEDVDSSLSKLTEADRAEHKLLESAKEWNDRKKDVDQFYRASNKLQDLKNLFHSMADFMTRDVTDQWVKVDQHDNSRTKELEDSLRKAQPGERQRREKKEINDEFKAKEPKKPEEVKASDSEWADVAKKKMEERGKSEKKEKDKVAAGVPTPTKAASATPPAVTTPVAAPDPPAKNPTPPPPTPAKTKEPAPPAPAAATADPPAASTAQETGTMAGSVKNAATKAADGVSKAFGSFSSRVSSLFGSTSTPSTPGAAQGAPASAPPKAALELGGGTTRYGSQHNDHEEDTGADVLSDFFEVLNDVPTEDSRSAPARTRGAEHDDTDDETNQNLHQEVGGKRHDQQAGPPRPHANENEVLADFVHALDSGGP